MRVIKEIVRSDCKITLFAWNNRYLIKVESGFLEQTFKVNEYDVSSEAEIERLVDDTFLAETLQRFGSMSKSLHEALLRT